MTLGGIVGDKLDLAPSTWQALGSTDGQPPTGQFGTVFTRVSESPGVRDFDADDISDASNGLRRAAGIGRPGVRSPCHRLSPVDGYFLVVYCIPRPGQPDRGEGC